VISQYLYMKKYINKTWGTMSKTLSRISVLLICILLFIPFSISGPALDSRGGGHGASIEENEDSPSVVIRSATRNEVDRPSKDSKKDIDKVSVGRNSLTGSVVEIPKLIDVREVRELVDAINERIPYVVEKPIDVNCNSVRTDIYEKSIFDCSEGVSALDNKETTLFTERHGDYAYIESVIPVDVNAPKHVLRIVHGVEFPTQQTTSVYIKKDDVWKHVCNIKNVGRQPTVSTCDVSSFVEGDAIEVRVENYAREGEAKWSVNAIGVVRKGLPGLLIPPSDGGNDEPTITVGGNLDGTSIIGSSRNKEKDVGSIVVVGPEDDPIEEIVVSDDFGGGPLNDFPFLLDLLEEGIFEPGPVVEEESELIGVESSEGGEISGDETENTATPETSPITGAVTGLDFLRNNGANFGLGLIILVMAGLYGQHFRRR
jgi:hypothetical protein